MMAGWIREGESTALRQFRRVKWPLTGLGVCMAWGAILVGPPLISLLHLNKSYAALGWMVQFLGFPAGFDVFAIPAGATLRAPGASRYSAFANSVRLVVLVAGLWLPVHTLGLCRHRAIWLLVSLPLLSYGTLTPRFP